MADILEEIIAHKRVEIDQRKRFIPAHQLFSLVEQQMNADGGQVLGGSMSQALMVSKTGIIAEFKRRSPSKGWIFQDAKVEKVAMDYQQSGATAMSILTDIDYFGGYDEYIQQARGAGVTLPILYKNFIIDEYQLFQARFCGASAVLLIAAALCLEDCKSLLRLSHELGLEVLLEMHDERDLEYAALMPDMYGINNRHLGTFETNVENSFLLASQLPAESCKVSESGISNPETVFRLRQAGFRGFLIGEHFMESEAPGTALAAFLSRLKSMEDRS